MAYHRSERELEELREKDLTLLSTVLGVRDELEEDVVKAAEDMQEALLRGVSFVLSTAQRGWMEHICNKLGVVPTAPPRFGSVPRGKEVPLLDVLKNLPKAPPGRRS